MAMPWFRYIFMDVIYLCQDTTLPRISVCTRSLLFVSYFAFDFTFCSCDTVRWETKPCYILFNFVSFWQLAASRRLPVVWPQTVSSATTASIAIPGVRNGLHVVAMLQRLLFQECRYIQYGLPFDGTHYYILTIPWSDILVCPLPHLSCYKRQWSSLSKIVYIC